MNHTILVLLHSFLLMIVEFENNVSISNFEELIMLSVTLL